MNVKLSYIALVLNGFLSKIVFSQLLIQDLSEEQYLYSVFNNTHDHIFPRDLQFQLQLTRNVGLLIYSIDKNLNQLIVNIIDSNEPTMKIEFRSQDYFIKLQHLCNCKLYSCLYEKLNFHLQIDSEIFIRCNNRTAVRRKFSNNKSLNNAYPIPKFLNSINSAFLWIINIPQYQNGENQIVYPIVEYLTGCIYNVTYDSEIIKLNIIGPIEKCENYCKPGICNGGQCLETFELQPVCNCDDSFYNGNYCNQTLSGWGTHSYEFQFSVMKLSWNCNANQILQITNKRMISIKIVLINSTKLNLKFQNYELSIPIANYKENSSYIMLLSLFNKSIEIQIKNQNQNWTKYSIYIGQDLSQEYFNNIKVLNDMCKEADAAYKISRDEISWIPLKLRKYLNGKKTVTGTISTTLKINETNTSKYETKEHDIKSTLFFTIGIVIPIFILFLAHVLVFIKFKISHKAGRTSYLKAPTFEDVFLYKK